VASLPRERDADVLFQNDKHTQLQDVERPWGVSIRYVGVGEHRRQMVGAVPTIVMLASKVAQLFG
jgi:hypothetical protein